MLCKQSTPQPCPMSQSGFVLDYWVDTSSLSGFVLDYWVGYKFTVRLRVVAYYFITHQETTIQS